MPLKSFKAFRRDGKAIKVTQKPLIGPLKALRGSYTTIRGSYKAL